MKTIMFLVVLSACPFSCARVQSDPNARGVKSPGADPNAVMAAWATPISDASLVSHLHQDLRTPGQYALAGNMIQAADALVTAVDTYASAIRDVQRLEGVQLRRQLLDIRAAGLNFRETVNANNRIATLHTLANDIGRQYASAKRTYDRLGLVDRRFTSELFEHIGEAVDDLTRSVNAIR